MLFGVLPIGRCHSDDGGKNVVGMMPAEIAFRIFLAVLKGMEFEDQEVEGRRDIEDLVF